MLSLSSVQCLPLLSLLVASVQSAPTGNSTSQPRPYKIDVDPAFIEETRKKVLNFRPSIETSDPAWTDGAPVATIAEIASYWTDSYNWSAVQSRINSEFSQYTITLPPPGGNYDLPQDIYFIHQRSNKTDAIPMLMLHGWPSTSQEWSEVIPELVNPSDDSKQAFHIVAPDFPGYGFSEAAKKSGLGPAEHSMLFAGLMEQLGYDRFAVYSTDLGFAIGQDMVVRYETKIVNHFTDFYFVIPTAEDTARYAANKTTPEENAYIASMNAFFNNHEAYAAIHSTLPLSIAYALNDTPLGFFAWFYQLFASVNDNTEPATPEELITQAMLLYIPGVYGNIRSYKELFGEDRFLPKKKSSVPTSVIQCGGKVVYPALGNQNYAPRDWIERHANLTYLVRHELGGHFPARTQPQMVIDDIRASFEQLGY